MQETYNDWIDVHKREYNSSSFGFLKQDVYDIGMDSNDFQDQEGACSSTEGKLDLGFAVFALVSTLARQSEVLTEEIRKLQPEGPSVGSTTSSDGGDLLQGLMSGLSSKLHSALAAAKDEQSELMSVWQFFDSNCKQVEILLHDDTLTRVYFPFLPMCTHATVETLSKAEAAIDRTSPEAKVKSVERASHNIILEMRYLLWLDSLLHQSWGLPAWFLPACKNLNVYFDIQFYIAVWINFVMLFSLRLDATSGDHTEVFQLGEWTMSESTTHTVLNVSVYVSMCFSLLNLLMYLLVHGKLTIAKNHNRALDAASSAKTRKKSPEITAYTGAVYLLHDYNCLFILAIIVASILALVDNHWWLSFHLFLLIKKSRPLQYVMQAVWKPKNTILLTGILFLLIVYVFSLIGFLYLNPDMPEEECTTLLRCFRFIFDNGFKNDGGIGGALNPLEGDQLGDAARAWERLAFDNIFNIILLILLLNIIFGITIDMFAELRASHEANKNDRINTCTICSLPRLQFISLAGQTAFFEHTLIDHNWLNYIYFLAYLDAKAPTEYTGIESYVTSRLKIGECDFFPVNRCILVDETIGTTGTTAEGDKSHRSEEKSQSCDGSGNRCHNMMIAALENVQHEVEGLRADLSRLATNQPAPRQQDVSPTSIDMREEELDVQL